MTPHDDSQGLVTVLWIACGVLATVALAACGFIAWILRYVFGGPGK